jgi:hypothetical protein
MILDGMIIFLKLFAKIENMFVVLTLLDLFFVRILSGMLN